MYLGDDLGGSALQVGTYHRLSVAIRRGCALRPKKLKRCFRRGTDAADALGAAMASTERGNRKRYTKREIIEIFPELEFSLKHPANGQSVPAWKAVVYLNDCSEWSREDIAAWLCRHGCQHEVNGGDGPLWKPVVEPSLNFHNLAEAMRRGCLLRPRKIKGQWKTGTTGACALGAVSDGAGFRGNGMYWPELSKMFPELHARMAHPLKGFRDEVTNVISSISDETDYSREQIADWLCIESGCTHAIQTSGLNPPMAA